MHRPPLTLVCFGVVFLPILVLTFLQPNIVELNPAGNCIQILSSLSTVTPTPQPTVSFEVPTWQPPVSTQFPPSTPSAKIDHYQLNSWSEVEAENVLASVKPTESNDWERRHAFFTLLRELLIRFPNLANREDLLLQLAFEKDWDLFDSVLSNRMGPAHSLATWQMLLENALNNGVIQPETVDDWLVAYMRPLYISFEQANNLFGDDKPVWTYVVSKFDDYFQATLLIKEIDAGKYQVLAFSGDEWEIVYRRSYSVTIRDLNGNGVPEIIKEHIYWWYGTPEIESELSVYEWDGNEFINLAPHLQSVRVNLNDRETDRVVWTFNPLDDGTSIIVGQGNISIGENCPPYRERIQYIWTGHTFEKDQVVVEPLIGKVAADCKVFWAKTAGENNPDSLRMIAEAVVDWPMPVDRFLGPAAEDYFRLWLANAYAIQGQPELALQTLEKLIRQPANPEYIALPQMAKTYQNLYVSNGPYAACRAVQQWIRMERSRLFDYSHTYSSNDWQILRQQWGIGESTGDYFFPCDLKITFSTLIQQQSFASRAELVRWLYRQQVQWNGLKQVDLDGDGVEDWLVVTRTGQYGGNELWALVQRHDRTLPILISNPSGSIEELATSWLRYLPEDGAPPVTFYRAEGDVIVFQLVEKEDQLYPFVHFTFSVYQKPRILGMELVGDSLDLYTSEGRRQYTWNTNGSRFEYHQEITNQPGTLSDWSLRGVEELIFDEQNAIQAIPVLHKLLLQPVPPGTRPDYKWIMDEILRTEPYKQYLLGLAYELTGDKENAVHAYWQLWHDHPESPYTIIARQKLTLMEP